MIITQKKPIEEVMALVGDAKTVALVGCGSCATACQTGGEAQIAELTAKMAPLQDQLLSAQAEKAELESGLADMPAQRDAALADQAQARRRNEEELEAYRRAERMERQAKERTEAMYQKHMREKRPASKDASPIPAKKQL